jgi:hypothetical protein
MPWRERSHAANGPPAVLRLSLLVTLRVRLLLLRWFYAGPQMVYGVVFCAEWDNISLP